MLNKINLFILVLTMGCSGLSAQLLQPVKWSFESRQLGNDEFELMFKADIDPGWDVYSYYLDEEAGPVPTMIEYEEMVNLELTGDVTEQGHKKQGKDPLFDNAIVIKFLSDEAYIIRQKVKLKGKEGLISGYLTFMTCDDNKCLPPTDVDFSFTLKLSGSGEGIDDETPKEMEEGSSSPTAVQTGSEEATGNNLDPVTWEADMEQEGQDFLLVFRAQIDPGWSIYSYYTEEGGPFPTIFSLEEESKIELSGEPHESGKRKEGPDPLFGGINVIKYLSGQEYIYRQKLNDPDQVGRFNGYITYMACDDERCLPPTDVDFHFNLATLKVSKGFAEEISQTVGDSEIIDQLRPNLAATYKNPLSNCGGQDTSDKNSLIWMFILGFLGGLLALLTPCVFPMIPLTVSFFTKDNKRKGWWNGTIYGISIIVIYVTIGLVLTATFGEGALNRLSTNWIANSLFFLIFVLFAFSFFGYYEITLPSSWANKSDRMADKGGLIGIFFMAFTLALVSFSCTGPIIGSAIVQAASNQVGPFTVMLGFSMALAIPFGLFAAFPSWLNSMPKSGSWMNSVKVTLGFLELALAFKFLSVADMTNHWNFLKYELFLGIWILIFAGLTAYLLGWIRFPQDRPLKKLSPTRWVFALGFLALTVYLSTGFMYNDKTESYQSLKLMSGLAPPAHYNYFLPEIEVDPRIKDQYPSYSKCANNIGCFKDYFEGLAYANEVNKPILLDHTGYGCVNCRKTEEYIWVDDRVRNMLNEDFVLISLYIDDDKKLDETKISKTRNAKLRNIGNKWTDFQIVNFQQNSQPLYVMITPEEEVISPPRGYREGVEGYLEYLECGLETFAATNSNGKDIGHIE